MWYFICDCTFSCHTYLLAPGDQHGRNGPHRRQGWALHWAPSLEIQTNNCTSPFRGTNSSLPTKSHQRLSCCWSATEHQLAIDAVWANQTTTPSTSQSTTPKTAPSVLGAHAPSASCVPNTTKRAHIEEIFDDEESGDGEHENARINPKPMGKCKYVHVKRLLTSKY